MKKKKQNLIKLEFCNNKFWGFCMPTCFNIKVCVCVCMCAYRYVIGSRSVCVIGSQGVCVCIGMLV